MENIEYFKDCGRKSSKPMEYGKSKNGEGGAGKFIFSHGEKEYLALCVHWCLYTNLTQDVLLYFS